MGLMGVVLSARAVRAAAPRPGPWRIRHELGAADRLLRGRLARSGAAAGIEIVRGDENLTMRVPAALLFEPDSTQLRPESLKDPPLGAVLELLRRRGRLVAQVNVYTDAIGGEIANHGLTEQRALAVVGALTAHRIGADRVTGAGCGASREIADDATHEGRERNRRVELVFSVS